MASGEPAVRYRAEALIDGGEMASGEDLLVRDGRVVGRVGQEEVTPGYRLERVAGALGAALVDIHMHGGFGVALDQVDPTREPGAVEHLRAELWAHGIGAFVASLPSLQADDLVRQLDRLAPFAGRVEAGMATLLGVHLEGPYLALARKGAHPPENLRAPDADELAGWLDRHPGLVRMVTLAPEAKGGEALVAAAQTRGAVAAVGHSDATADETRRAVAFGARHATHLWNGMPPLGHRAPGVVGAFLESPEATVELICDGHHIDPLVVALTIHHVGPARVTLVTDSMAAAGLGDGVFRIGDYETTVRDGVSRLADGTLAGSTLVLDEAVRNVTAWRAATLPSAHAMASAQPARILGATGFGSLAEGAVAALVTVGGEGAVAPLASPRLATA